MSKEFRYFTLYKLNNKIIQFGRVKISSESGKPLDAAKKLLSSICEYEGLTKNNKLKCKAHFYIRETTKQSKKQIFGPYKGSFKKYDKPVSIKLKNGIYENAIIINIELDTANISHLLFNKFVLNRLCSCVFELNALNI